MKKKLLLRLSLFLSAGILFESQQVSATEMTPVPEDAPSSYGASIEGDVETGETDQPGPDESIDDEVIDGGIEEKDTMTDGPDENSLPAGNGEDLEENHPDDQLIIEENTIIARKTMVEHGERIEGHSRDEVAAAVSQRGWRKSDLVFVANGFKAGDALTASSLAGIYDAPILFTRDNYFPAAAAHEIKRLRASRVIVLGGIHSVPQAVYEEIEKLGVDIQRIDGQDRYTLASNIANQLLQVHEATNAAFLVNGDAYADAISIAPVAAAKGIPIYLTRTNSLHKEVQHAAGQIKYWYIVGGPSSISDAVIQELQSYGGVVKRRFDGFNRYQVNRSINHYFKMNTKAAYVASGERFADALSLASLAGREGRGIILVKNKNRQEVPRQRDFIVKYGIKKLVFVGGIQTISPDTRLEMMGYNRFDKLSHILNSRSGNFIKPFSSVNNPVITKEMITDRQAVGVADPFIVEDNGRYHMFFEVLTARHDEIGHAYSDNLIDWTYTQIVLDSHWHRSAYPQVFKVDGLWYMIPDSAGRGNIRLYQAEAFPYQWEYVTTLIDTSKAIKRTIVDSNIFEYQGTWYMTTTGGEDGWNKGVALYINTSGDWKNNQWRKHPANIIIPTNAAYSTHVRGAGNPMIFDDHIFLPIQATPTSTKIYGEKAFLFMLTNLTPTTVTVKNLGVLVEGQKNDSWNSLSMHHVAHAPYKDRDIFVVDGQNEAGEYSIGLYQYI